ncbi:tyrosine-type recombinase/integrase [Alkaliphilus sp. B6464]|uniref:tyrosine-type recombinase/integrase n=1 Tax=Alkaliphilus sp. B6464 TaxID=2731219 RepID=UPI001BAC6DAA|nr:tyrosine-type recombinase/integrase [Alkaliphilus sp. B6464]QUH21881.1 tyrosine-type recombinase/integrase [Alkaliphilus sp. B6464]
MDALEKKKKEKKLKDDLKIMPKPVKDFFRRISGTSIRTRTSYYYDLKLFFEFLIEFVDEFEGVTLSSFSYNELNKINLEHIDEFKEYITYYETQIKASNGANYEITRQNSEWGINRKFAALRSLFSNLYEISLTKDENDDNRLKKNFARLIKLEDTNVKEKYRMSIEQIKEFLDVIEAGEGKEGKLTNNQKKIIKNNYLKRNLCIISILAETGIRISELVGIDFQHIYFDEKMIKVTRKGGDEEFVYYDFSEEYIMEYYEERKLIEPKKNHENAFFLSSYKSRITDRGVQKMIEKYAQLFTHHTISPHTFRRSFATNLYEITGDVYLVASLIGDTVEVAAKHYTKQNEKRKRDAIKGYLAE